MVLSKDTCAFSIRWLAVKSGTYVVCTCKLVGRGGVYCNVYATLLECYVNIYEVMPTWVIVSSLFCWIYFMI